MSLGWVLGGTVLAVAITLWIVRPSQSASTGVSLNPLVAQSTVTSPPLAVTSVKTESTMSIVSTPGPTIPDPWNSDNRFDCYGGSTSDMSRCHGYDLTAARANLRITVEAVVRSGGPPELIEQQQIWEEEVDQYCPLVMTGGTIDRLYLPLCYRQATNARADLLELLDIGDDFPMNPVNLWGVAADRFVHECQSQVTGTVAGPTYGSQLVSEETSVQISLEPYGPTTGTVDISVVLRTEDGVEHIADSSTLLWGKEKSGFAAGVYVAATSWDNEDPRTSYGYWWIDINDGAATGELIALFEPDAISNLTLTETTC